MAIDLPSAIKGAFAQAGDNAVQAAQQTLNDAAMGAFAQAQAAVVPAASGPPPQVATVANTQPGAAVSPTLTKPVGMAALPRWVKIFGIGLVVVVGGGWLFKKWK